MFLCVLLGNNVYLGCRSQFSPSWIGESSLSVYRVTKKTLQNKTKQNKQISNTIVVWVFFLRILLMICLPSFYLSEWVYGDSRRILSFWVWLTCTALVYMIMSSFISLYQQNCGLVLLNIFFSLWHFHVRFELCNHYIGAKSYAGYWKLF